MKIVELAEEIVKLIQIATDDTSVGITALGMAQLILTTPPEFTKSQATQS